MTLYHQFKNIHGYKRAVYYDGSKIQDETTSKEENFKYHLVSRNSSLQDPFWMLCPPRRELTMQPPPFYYYHSHALLSRQKKNNVFS